MCDACLDRARRLGELIAHFEGLKAKTIEPLTAARLHETVAELRIIADQLSEACGPDIVWAEDDAPAPARRVEVKTA